MKPLVHAIPHQSFLSIGSEVPIDKKSSFPSGEAKGQKTYAFTTQRTAQFRELRADAIRPDSGVYKTAALQGAHSPEPIIFLSIRGNAEHIRRTQLRNSAADGLVNLNQLL